jgi:dihydropteroate synthase
VGWMLGARLFRVHAPGPVRDALAVAAAVGAGAGVGAEAAAEPR